MLTFCFDEAYRSGGVLTVKLSEEHRPRPLFAYWVPMCCWMAPGRVRIIGAQDEDEVRRNPFVYVVELDIHAGRWCRDNPEAELVVLPPAVRDAARAGRALVLVSNAHEGSPTFGGGEHAGDVTLFDKLATLAENNDLTPEQVWFATGNMRVVEEEKEWLAARGRVRSPFIVRNCEIASYGLGLAVRESFLTGRGPFDVAVLAVRQGKGQRPQTKVAWVRRPFPALAMEGEWPEARRRYACLNRLFRPHRWWTVGRLFREGLLGEGLVSFPAVGPTELAVIELESVAAELLPLIESLPLSLEEGFEAPRYLEILQLNIDQTTYAVTTVPPEVARDAVFHLVTETHYAETRFVTEKSFKALLGRGPFAVVGPYGNLEYMRSIGVETWGDVLDESYDLVGEPVDPTWSTQRFEKCMDAVLPLLHDPVELRRIERTHRDRRNANLRWLMEGRKPWDGLLDELEETLVG